MDPREQKIRDDHPDWTDEQVTAELGRTADPPPDPKPPEPDNRAFAEMRRRAEQAEREAQTARDALAERERKEAEEQGRWKELAEKEKARADSADERWTKAEQDRAVEGVARDLKYRDPDLIQHLLPASIDRNDTAAVKQALEDVAKQRPHLIDGTAPPPSGGPAGGARSDPPKLTAEQLAAMSPEQIRKLDPKVVNEALAG